MLNCEDQAARNHVEGARPMTGFLATLTPEQRGAASAYRGADGPIGNNDNVPVADRATYISTLNGRFYPFDPRPCDVDIVHIAHSLGMSCRYTGACLKFYSTAEHSVHIARWLLPRYGAAVALVGLLHDAPEALSGFGDTARPSKRKVPLIGSVEADIWKRAIAPRYELPAEMPAAVHEADGRIIADEMTQNMYECDPAYDNPLGITLEYWTPEQGRVKFLAEFMKLQRKRQQSARQDADDYYPAADREASAADRAYQLMREEAA